MVGGPRTGPKRIFEDFRKRCSTLCASRRSAKKVGPLLAAVLHGAATGDRHFYHEGLVRFVSRGQALSPHLQRRNFAARFIPHRQSWRISRSELRIRENEDNVPGQQRLWQTWGTLPARHRDGLAFSSAERWRA